MPTVQPHMKKLLVFNGIPERVPVTVVYVQSSLLKMRYDRNRMLCLFNYATLITTVYSWLSSSPFSFMPAS